MLADDASFVLKIGLEFCDAVALQFFDYTIIFECFPFVPIDKRRAYY